MNKEKMIKDTLEKLSWDIYELLEKCESQDEVKAIFKEINNDVETSALSMLKAFEEFKDCKFETGWRFLCN